MNNINTCYAMRLLYLCIGLTACPTPSHAGIFQVITNYVSQCFCHKNHDELLHDTVVNALLHFKTINLDQLPALPAIVCDIDGTLLDKNFEANELVQILYGSLKNSGFVIFLVTTRPASEGHLTRQDLIKTGYCLNNVPLICMPDPLRDLRDQSPSLQERHDFDGRWKEAIRANIVAGKYTQGCACFIAGTIDDLDENLQGNNVGYAVKIPHT